MSNPMAVATVTAAITTLVQQAVDMVGITPGPKVAPGTLADVGEHARVSVALYRVTRNASWSTADLPVRSAGGALSSRPTAALDLHYLLTFRADTPLDAQTMLAVTTAAFETNPTISPQLLDATETDHPEIAGNDLRIAPERVRVCSEGLSVDELTRMWALYTADTFALTLAVSAGPVLVESWATPSTGLPVRQLSLGALPFDAPRLDSVAGPGGVGAPVIAATPMPDLRLLGAKLSPREGETVQVLLDDLLFTPTVVDDANLTIPAPGLAPGLHRVQVWRNGPPLDPGVSTTPTRQRSETRAVSVVPALGGVSRTVRGPVTGRNGRIKAAVTPPVARGQRVRLLLDRSGPDPRAVALPAAALPSPPTPATATVTFDFTDLPAGSYRVTLEVDGARTIPPVDAAGRYLLPVVTV